MVMQDCCLRAIKHGFNCCPECGTAFIPFGPQQTLIRFKAVNQR